MAETHRWLTNACDSSDSLAQDIGSGGGTVNGSETISGCSSLPARAAVPPDSSQLAASRSSTSLHAPLDGPHGQADLRRDQFGRRLYRRCRRKLRLGGTR